MLIIGVAPKNSMAKPPVTAKKVTPSDIVAGVITAVLIPFTVILGTLFIPNGTRKHLLIILAVLVECLAAFFISFEKKKPSAKDIAVLGVLSAAAVAGRELFFMFPQFKPVAAIVIISGTALGAQAGFLVGAVSMLVSNMLFGQGMWTPLPDSAWVNRTLPFRGAVFRFSATFIVLPALSGVIQTSVVETV